jgi:chromosome segregation ATPase
MTLEQTLKTLKSAFSGKTAEAESLAKKFSELSAKNETLAAEYVALSEKLEAQSAALAERDGLASKVEELSKALAVAESQKVAAVSQIESAGKVAAKIAASVGVPAVEINPADSAVSPQSNEQVWESYIAIKNPSEKKAFYDKNRAAIIAHLGVR